MKQEISQPDRIPSSESKKRESHIVVFFGPPGVGKTTAIAKLDREGGLGGAQLIMNDIGGSSYEKKKFTPNTAENIGFINAGCLGCSSKQEFQEQIDGLLKNGRRDLVIEPTGAVDIVEVESALEELGESQSARYVGVWSVEDHKINKQIGLFKDNLGIFQRQPGVVYLTQHNAENLDDPKIQGVTEYIALQTGSTQIILDGKDSLSLPELFETSSPEGKTRERTDHSRTAYFAGGAMLKDGAQIEDIITLSKGLGNLQHRMKIVIDGQEVQIVNGRVAITSLDGDTASRMVYFTESNIAKELLESFTDGVRSDIHGNTHDETGEKLHEFISERIDTYKSPVVSNGDVLTSFPEADIAEMIAVEGMYVTPEQYAQIPKELRDRTLKWDIVHRLRAVKKLPEAIRVDDIDEQNIHQQKQSEIKLNKNRRALGQHLSWHAYHAAILKDKKYSALIEPNIPFGPTAVDIIKRMKIGLTTYKGLSGIVSSEMTFPEDRSGDHKPWNIQKALDWAVTGEGSISPTDARQVATKFYSELIRRFSKGELSQDVFEFYEAKWKEVMQFFKDKEVISY